MATLSSDDGLSVNSNNQSCHLTVMGDRRYRLLFAVIIVLTSATLVGANITDASESPYAKFDRAAETPADEQTPYA